MKLPARIFRRRRRENSLFIPTPRAAAHLLKFQSQPLLAKACPNSVGRGSCRAKNIRNPQRSARRETSINFIGELDRRNQRVSPSDSVPRFVWLGRSLAPPISGFDGSLAASPHLKNG